MIAVGFVGLMIVGARGAASLRARSWPERVNALDALDRRACLGPRTSRPLTTGRRELVAASTSDAELGDLLTDPARSAAVLLGGMGAAAMKVEDVVAFVRARHPDARSPEAQIDRFVSRVGGQKEPGIDLKDVRRQVIGRLLRRRDPLRVSAMPASSTTMTDSPSTHGRCLCETNGAISPTRRRGLDRRPRGARRRGTAAAPRAQPRRLDDEEAASRRLRSSRTGSAYGAAECAPLAIAVAGRSAGS